MNKRRMQMVIALCALILGAFSLAACGGDDEGSTSAGSDAAGSTTSEADSGDSGGSSGGSTISVEADPGGDLAYTETSLSAEAGSDTLEFDNPASISHDVVIEDDSGETLAETDTISDSTTSTTVDLEPGTYTYYCSLPGHREAGMEGTLDVK